MLCALCGAINVKDLIVLAGKYHHGSKAGIPRPWKHHSKYDDLAAAAEAGCELCKVLVRALDGTVLSAGRAGKTYKAEMLEMEEDGSGMGLDVEIEVEGKNSNGAVFEESKGKIPLDRLSFYMRGSQRREWLIVNFSLQKCRGKVKSVDGIEIGHFVLDPNLGSEANFEIARDWIHTCSSTHYECPVIEDRPLPTRVIHVGSDTREPYLLKTRGKKGKYIALSHCWGGKISNRSQLNTTTSKIFNKRIALEKLPPNFRDAILITRRLGFQFLWIDCLCIMQDSSEDWEIESKHMGNVYRDATLTIAAAAASNSTDGILNKFEDYDLTGISISLKLSQNSPPEDHIDAVLRDNNREQLDILLKKGPLADRGWTFQEEILSARTLYYGRMQIYWQCLHDHASADGLRSRAPIYQRAFRYERIKDQIHESQGLKRADMMKSPYVFVNKDQTRSAVHQRISMHIIMEYHKEMVVDYCSRHLSFSRDKFPAFSGIVTLVRDILHTNGYPDSRYVAGVWTSHFRQGLVWYYGDDAIPSTGRAPSWSWATTNGIVVFHPSTFSHDTFQSTPIDPQLLSHNVMLMGHNPYGEIQHASLEILGSTMGARFMNGLATNGNNSACGFVHWDTRATGEERRTGALFVCRIGSSAMFLFSPQDEKESLPKTDTIMDEEDGDTADNTRYKVMFVATQKRQAHGLVLKKCEMNQDEEAKGGNEAGDKAGGKAKSNTEHQAGHKNAAKDGQKHGSNTTLTKFAASITKYRRVGYVRLYSEHGNVRKLYDAYRWADLEGWKREKFVLI
ncbi:dc73f6b5-c4e1-4f24-89d9-0e9e9d402e38 [Sclerotinia trifoliorum]|uniref:Dc73f6b5-c4e1-4f24-89d9-0e9e9d402e38 n=1 Tax=Sclerotinia trifoliorum TaxID=28548 RepID=A0A8H2ZQ18_9HELO|nr:dc73f6b5-c4e1-4f24-89d9-0e9e9d402e38 [Sclerotinia trifoliorum]